MKSETVHSRVRPFLRAIAVSTVALALIGCGDSVPSSGVGPEKPISGGNPPSPVPDGPLGAAAYVNPFVATAGDYGQDLPGAYVPNGLAKVNPVTWPYRSHSGYDYMIPGIVGFTHTNLDGVGSNGGGGDLFVAPIKGRYLGRSRPRQLGDPDSLGSLPYGAYAKAYSHLAEKAEPGYYQVHLLEANPASSSLEALLPGAINAEMTVDTRTGWDRYTFPPTTTTATLIVDLSVNFHDRIDATEEIGSLPDGRASIRGQVDGSFFNVPYRLYYYAETTQPVTSVRTWGGDGTLTGATRQQGPDIGAVLEFDVTTEKAVGLRITLSPISVEQARIDQTNELGNRSFEQVRADAYLQWDRLLSRVEVTASGASDPDGSLEALFYTHLYKMFGLPVNATSTTGLYRGVDGTIREARDYIHYDGFTTFDDFHKYGVIALVDPPRFRDMTRSMVDLFADLSHTDRMSPSSLVSSVPTVRFERSAAVIADAVVKGVYLPRLAEAYPALKAYSNGMWDEANVQLGYFPDNVGDLVSSAYDDFAMSVIARSLGYDADADDLARRATNYRAIFNKDGFTAPGGDQVGLLWPRAADGSFNSVDPEAFGAASLYQGTLWQYNFYNTADLGGLVQLMGGQSRFAQAASHFFGEQAPDDCSRMLHSNANEVDLIGPYVFNYAGLPNRTQYWVRQIFGGSSCNRYIASGDAFPYALTRNGEFILPSKMRVYQLDPVGLLPTMDNDAGTMSSMFVSAALGLFPATPATDVYLIGSPFFEKVVIPTADGGRFSISAHGVTPDSYYIQSARLGSCESDRVWIRHGDLASGGALDFVMGPDPSTWGRDSAIPPSLSDTHPVMGWGARTHLEEPVCP